MYLIFTHTLIFEAYASFIKNNNMNIGNFAIDGKADRCVLQGSLTDTFKIPKEFMEPIVALLCKFELAIPLDRETFLIPSLLLEINEQFSRSQYNFPKRRIESFVSTHGHVVTVTPDFHSSTEHFPTTRPDLSAAAHHKIEKGIELHSTGLCFRRIFTTDHIPSNFWPRVIARFLASAESFYKIISSNCCPEIQPNLFVGVGGATIGALMCTWSYGKNSIELKLGDDVVLCVNALFSTKNVYGKKDKRKVPISHTVEKIKKMQIYCDVDTFMQANVSDGFEVSVPDYLVVSYSKFGGEVYQSDLMSMQILSHVLETLDEVFKEWFNGLLELGVYSERNLCHFIPCPFCYGDRSPLTTDDTGLIKDGFSSERSLMIGQDPVGFSVQHCLFQGRRSDIITCPRHGQLALQCLTPDLVSCKVMLFVEALRVHILHMITVVHSRDEEGYRYEPWSKFSHNFRR